MRALDNNSCEETSINMCVPKVYIKDSEQKKRSRMKRLRLKRDIRYKLIAIVGCTLLVLSVFFSADIWLIEREKSRQLGLSGQNNANYQVSEVIDGLFKHETQNGVFRSVREDMQNTTGSGMNTNDSTTEPDDPFFRRQFPRDIFTLEQKRMGAIILHIFGIIYMFVGLALVCDEFFVPSLEIIIEKLHIPEDVAGATFMAAGGSAPEFFTSLVGVFFARNAVGFGTIVGSAVFNILFVIGVVGLLAKNVLLLTWWPLFRDTSFYAIALGTLIGFFQNGLIEWYESLALFILYILYVLFMFINTPAERISRKFVKKLQDKLCCCRCSCKSSRVHSAPDSESDGSKQCHTTSSQGHQGAGHNGIQGSTILVRPRELSNVSKEIEMLDSLPGTVPTSEWQDTNSSKLAEHHTLRISSAKHSEVMINSDVATENLYPVIKESMPSPGSEQRAFKLPPLTKPQLMTKSSTKTLLDLPGFDRRSSADSGFRTNSSCAGSEIDSPPPHEVVSRLSSNRSLVISNSQAVFMAPDSPYMEEVESVLSIDNKTEEDKNLCIRRRSLSSTPSRTHRSVSPLRTTTACSNNKESEASREEDISSPDKPEEQEEVGEEEGDEDEGIVHVIPPKGWLKRVAYVFLLPLIILLFFTLPDVKKPRWRCFFPYVFVGSVLWIGLFSYFMVWWATEFGDTANIPPSVMGLTFLAAGTSIPDLITSVIVARKGHGDMALSSSIGSNMFDVTVGLPIPWLLFSAVNSGQPVSVLSNGLFCSVLLLIGMLLLMIISIAIFRWRLGKILGLVYMIMYFVFVTLSILLELVIHCNIGG